jgi:Fe-S oxidoreductase
LLKIAAKLQKPFAHEGYIRHLPLALAGYTSLGSLPALTDIPLRARVPQIIHAKGEKRMRVGLFSGCLIDFIYPEIGEKMIDLLSHFGCEVILPENQTCCGIPASCVGEISVASDIAMDNINAFADVDIDAIVTGCATCASALKAYPELLAQSPSGKDAYEFASMIYCICDFLCDVLNIDIAGYPETPARISVTYHDSCHLKRRLGAHTQPRKLLASCGYKLREMEDADRCCGFAGSFALDYPELAAHILKHKLDSIRASNADAVAMDCPGCIMHIGSRPGRIQVSHTAELLWDAILRVNKG